MLDAKSATRRIQLSMLHCRALFILEPASDRYRMQSLAASKEYGARWQLFSPPLQAQIRDTADVQKTAYPCSRSALSARQSVVVSCPTC